MASSSVRRRFAVQNEVLTEGADGQGETIATKDVKITQAIRSKVAAVLDACISDKDSSTKNQTVCHQLLEEEARKLSDSVDVTIARDQFARQHNQKMKRRQDLYCALGFFYLICPILIMFDKVMSFFPADFIDMLQYAAQENTRDGMLSRVSLNIVLVASEINSTDKERGRIFLTMCIGGLIILLFLVRYTTQRQYVLNAEQRDQVNCIKVIVDEELSKRKDDIRLLD